MNGGIINSISGFTGQGKRRGMLPMDKTLSGMPTRVGSISSRTTSTSEFNELDLRFSWDLYLRIKQRILQMHLKESTKRSYHNTWVRMNRFISAFDRIPPTWEERMSIWATHLANHKKHSNTVSSYMSAIRHVLALDGIFVPKSTFELAMIIKACKLHNDVLYIRLPIQQKLLNRILQFVKEHYQHNLGQVYLAAWLRAAFVMGYYGLMRISEISKGPHAVKAQDIVYGHNKRKLTLYLRSSKTHSISEKPQIIHIQGDKSLKDCCPYSIMTHYTNLRGRRADTEGEQFLIHQDGKPVTANQITANMKQILTHMQYDCTLYGFHSCRIGRATDRKKQGKTVKFIQNEGRWKREESVLRYIRW